MSDVAVASELQSAAIPIYTRRVALGSKADWDPFAKTCQCSYMGSHSYVTAHALVRRVTVLNVFYGQIKIAQCAVVFGRFGRNRRVGEFVDSLQVLPSHDWLWPQVMEAVLRTLGPGIYTYGSKWSIEHPREDQFASLVGVSITKATKYRTQVVDFARWPSWEAYEKEVSKNVKRNADKALKADPATYVILKRGVAATTEVLRLTRMRFQTRRRKGLEDWTTYHAAILRYLGRTVLMRDGSYTAKVIHQDRIMAYFSGIDFGTSTFYIDGASETDNNGSAWLLQLRMLKRAWKPNGKFFLSMYEIDSDWVGRDNILRSRHHLRPDEFPNTVINFIYRPDTSHTGT